MKATENLDASLYRPTRPETAAAFELLMTHLAHLLHDVPQDVLASGADELLAVAHDDSMTDRQRGQAAADLLGIQFSPEQWATTVRLCKAITDYSAGKQGAGGAAGMAGLDDTFAVTFDDAGSESSGSLADEVQDARSVSSGLADDDEGPGSAQLDGGASLKLTGEAEGDDTDDDGLPIAAIDAFWLQRHVAELYADPSDVARITEGIMEALGNPDPRACQRELVSLLDFDKIEFIQLLLQHAAKIYWITRLKSAESDQQRQAIQDAMAEDTSGAGADLLARLSRTTDSANWLAERGQAMRRRLQAGVSQLRHKRGGAGGATTTVVDEDGSGVTLRAPVDTQSRASNKLDLARLTFRAGAHTMTNASVELPEGAWRAVKQDYEEVHIPAPAPAVEAPGDRTPISELPSWMHAAFAGMTSLNRVQSKLAPTLLGSAENVLLCAPTGAGKTNVAVLSMLACMAAHRQPDGTLRKDDFKIVYVAPMKALVQEVVSNLQQRLGEPFGLAVRELSGDVSLSQAELSATQIIVTTPEKWDIVTRKAGDRTYTQAVKLVVIDEIHLLHDDRGPVLEALVARTLRQVEATAEQVRIVGLSATLPNFADVATFLRVRPETGLFFFDNSYRPCPLQQLFIGVAQSKPLKRLATMNDIAFQQVLDQAHEHSNQSMVFVHTRKDTARTAQYLLDRAVDADVLSAFLAEGSDSRQILAAEAANCKSSALAALLPYGFAVHHAGLAREDRTLVEDLFADGHVRVLVCTATLAWGVNLPAHTVIIKGTQVYSPEAGSWVELSPQDMLQMLGRAGRPQYDRFGEGIVITTSDKLQYYLSLLNTQLPIESQLVKRLPDALNAEVAAGTVASLEDAAAWLGYTYLYVRMLSAPSVYSVPVDQVQADPKLMQRRTDLAHAAAVLLDEHHLVRYDRTSGALHSTPLGRVAAGYYVSHATVAVFNEHLRADMSDIDLIRVFSMASEFKQLVVRAEEKAELRALLDRVPIPVCEPPEEPSAKVNVLLQTWISRLQLDGFALMADMAYITGSAGRLFRAIFDVAIKRGWAALALRALTMSKAIARRMWASHTPMRQFVPGLPDADLYKLERKSLPWDRYADLSAVELGELLRKPAFGKVMKKLVDSFPRLDLSAQVQPLTRSLLRVQLVILPDFEWSAKYHGSSMRWWITVEDTDGERLLYAEPWTLRARDMDHDSVVVFYVPLLDPMPPVYYVRVVSDNWLHAEATLPLSFQQLVLPQKFPPSTQLLDLAPLPITELGEPQLVALYDSYAAGPAVPRIAQLNSIQTQAFQAVFQSDENVLLTAPAGSGKGLIAELALLRLWAVAPDACAVMIGCNDAAVAARVAALRARIGAGLGKSVAQLTGNATADADALAQSHVVVGTAAAWDRLSRRWKQLASLSSVGLLVVEGLHELGSGESGPALEAGVSRARIISFSRASEPDGTALPLRIVATGAPIANSHDVSEWLGVRPGKAAFNFAPTLRPTPLEMRVQSFDVEYLPARLAAMARPTYAALANYCSMQATALPEHANAAVPGVAPGVVWTTSAQQAQLCAVDITAFASAAGKPGAFLPPAAHVLVDAGSLSDAALAAAQQSTLAELCEVADKVQGIEPALAACLRSGVGYLTPALPSRVASAVQALWEAGRLGVLCASADQVWTLRHAGAAVAVVQATQRWDAGDAQVVDYPMSQVLELVGAAGRPGVDARGVAVLLCVSHRREYLRKFLHEALPVESALDLGFDDILNAEVCSGNVSSRQTAMDWLTWTFYFRRLSANPNYYGVAEASEQHRMDHMSALVESAVDKLDRMNCVDPEPALPEGEVEGLAPLPLGQIAAFYDVLTDSIQMFAAALTEPTKMRGMLILASQAGEFSALPMRASDAGVLRRLAAHLPVPVQSLQGLTGADASLWQAPSTKANVLLQHHFTYAAAGAADDRALPVVLHEQQAKLLPVAVQLGYALVDVAVANGWLKPALAGIQLVQSVVQGVWANKRASSLLQLPHFDQARVDLAQQLGLDSGKPGTDEDRFETVMDISDCSAEARAAVLEGLSAAQIAAVAAYANAFPVMEAEAAWRKGVGSAELPAQPGSKVTALVSLLRNPDDEEDMDEDDGAGWEVPPVQAPHYPARKAENWWVLLADDSVHKLYAVQQSACAARSTRVKLAFIAPDEPGEYELSVQAHCDSYVGAEFIGNITLHVGGGSAQEDRA